MLIKDNDVILFQGDSITDSGREWQQYTPLGFGYATIVTGWLSALYPEKKLTFINRGIGGNRVKDLQDRWEQDCLSLKPNLLSILIGVNDCWRRYDSNDPTPPEAFESRYRDILQQVKDRLPDTKILICEPFLLPVQAEQKQWREDLDPKIQVVRELAREFASAYLPLDGIFAQAAAIREMPFWSEDGVHPTFTGHALIARHWIEAVTKV